MTTVYGSWVPSSGVNQRMRLRLDYTVPSAAPGASTVTVTGSVWVEGDYSFYDNNNTFAWSGTLLGSGTASKTVNVATGGSDEIHTFSQVVTLTTAPQTKVAAFSLTGIDYVGASTKAYVEAQINIPAKAVVVGDAPTGLTVTRVSDVRHDLAWSATSTASAPIEGFEILRYDWSNPAAGYVTVGAVGGVARAWVDNGTRANGKYSWEVRAFNSAGKSPGATVGPVATTPAAASGVTAIWSGTDAVVYWTRNAPHATAQTLQMTSGAVWADVPGHVDFSGSLSQRTVVDLASAPASSYLFRVVSKTALPTTLTATSAASNELVVAGAPNPPTPIAPRRVQSSAEPTVFMWRHNPTDTTDQTAYEVGYRPAGSSTWTVAAGSMTATEQHAETLATGGWEWQARTKGAASSWSDWSPPVAFTVYNLPAVSITAPADASTIASNRLTLTVDYTDPQSAAMTGWRAELLEGGQVIETLTGNGATLSVTFATPLENLTSYSATFRATAGTGLQSAAASVSVSVDFLPPPVPLLDASWDEPSGTAQLAVTIPTAGVGEEPATSARIERSDDGGASWTVVADDLPLGAGVGDDRVALNLDALYRAVSISALGVETKGASMPVTTASSRVWLQASGGKVHVLGNAQLAPTFDHEKVTERYIGRAYPTAHYGIGETVRVSVSGAWTEDDEIAQDVTPVLAEDVWYRDPAGRAFWATVESMATPQPWSGRRDVSFTVEKVDVDG